MSNAKIANDAQGLPAILISQMIKIGFRTPFTEEGIGLSIAKDWWADEFGKVIAKQGVFADTVKNIESLLTVQETSR